MSKRRQARIEKAYDLNKCGKDKTTVKNSLYLQINTCIVFLAIATTLITLATLGKYKGTLASADTARVANYVVELSKTQENITEILPSSTQNIEFEVRNFEGDILNPQRQNEVKSKYKIKLEIIDGLDLPLIYHLYRVSSPGNESEVALTNGESDYIFLEPTVTSHSYKLELIWQNGYDGIAYQNLSDHIKITVNSEQVD